MRVLTVTAVALMISVAFAASVTGEVITAKTLDRFYDPIEVRSKLFPEMHNLELNRLGLMACKDGKLDFIPFQFDEWTPDGEMILKMGSENNAAKSNGKLDPQDMLVFMARNLGDRVTPETWREIASNGVEIEATDPLTQGRGWAYLLYFPQEIPAAKLKSVGRLLETKTPEFRAYGSSFTAFSSTRKVGGKTYRFVTPTLVSIKPAAGGNDQDFIDRYKWRVSVSLMFGLIKLKLNEDNVIGGISKYFDGPVRGPVLQWAKLQLPMKIKSPRIDISVYIYDTMMFVPVQARFPFNPGYVLTNFQLSFGTDLHEPQGRGMKYYSDTNPKGFLMDGRMDKSELNEYNEAPDNWRCIVGPQGWMMHRSLWDEDYRRQADIRMKYIDDVNHHSPPTLFPGDLGYYYTLSTIESMEPRTYFFQADWYYPYHLYTPNGPDMKAIEAICNVRDFPLEIESGDRKVKNRGAVLTPLIP